MNEVEVPKAAERKVFIDWGRRRAYERRVIEEEGVVDCLAAEILIQIREENVFGGRQYGDIRI